MLLAYPNAAVALPNAAAESRSREVFLPGGGLYRMQMWYANKLVDETRLHYEPAPSSSLNDTQDLAGHLGVRFKLGEFDFRNSVDSLDVVATAMLNKLLFTRPDTIMATPYLDISQDLDELFLRLASAVAGANQDFPGVSERFVVCELNVDGMQSCSAIESMRRILIHLAVLANTQQWDPDVLPDDVTGVLADSGLSAKIALNPLADSTQMIAERLSHDPGNAAFTVPLVTAIDSASLAIYDVIDDLPASLPMKLDETPEQRQVQLGEFLGLAMEAYCNRVQKSERLTGSASCVDDFETWGVGTRSDIDQTFYDTMDEVVRRLAKESHLDLTKNASREDKLATFSRIENVKLALGRADFVGSTYNEWLPPVAPPTQAPIDSNAYLRWTVPSSEVRTAADISTDGSEPLFMPQVRLVMRDQFDEAGLTALEAEIVAQNPDTRFRIPSDAVAAFVFRAGIVVEATEVDEVFFAPSGGNILQKPALVGGCEVAKIEVRYEADFAVNGQAEPFRTAVDIPIAACEGANENADVARADVNLTVALFLREVASEDGSASFLIADGRLMHEDIFNAGGQPAGKKRILQRLTRWIGGIMGFGIGAVTGNVFSAGSGAFLGVVAADELLIAPRVESKVAAQMRGRTTAIVTALGRLVGASQGNVDRDVRNAATALGLSGANLNSLGFAPYIHTWLNLGTAINVPRDPRYPLPIAAESVRDSGGCGSTPCIRATVLTDQVGWNVE